MPRPPRFYLWISLAALVVLLLAALVSANLWVHSYLRSENFRALVASETGEALQAETTYTPLNWSGNSVYTDNVQGTGLPGTPIKTMRADQVRAQVNWRAIMDGAWRVDEISVGYLEGTFQQPVRQADADAEIPPPPAPSGLWAYLPRRFELGHLHASQARLTFQDAQARDLVTVRDTALKLRPDGTGWIIEGQKGTLQLPDQPSLTIDTFRSRLQKGSFFLTDARLRIGETGTIGVSGEFSGDSQLDVHWQQVDVAPFLRPEWRSHLSGVMDGTSLIKWPPSGSVGATASGRFELKDGLLQGVPVFEQIAAFTGAPQFRRMPLQQMTGLYNWSGGVLTVTELVAESKGLLRVEGQCTIGARGELQSTLRVGVTPQTLQWLPGSRERVFTEAANGYLWTDVRLTGTIDNPQEDLSRRLITAMGNEVIDQGTKVIEQLPNAAQDGAKKALDLLSPLLR